MIQLQVKLYSSQKLHHKDKITMRDCMKKVNEKHKSVDGNKNVNIPWKPKLNAPWLSVVKYKRWNF